MKSILPVMAGVAVAALIAFGLGLAAGATGEKPGFEGIVIGVAMGGVVTLIVNNFQGNRKIPKADRQTRERALAFAPNAEKACLYLMRTGFVGKAIGMNVALDGRDIVQLKSPRFTRIEITPGSHSLAASFRGPLGAQTKPSEIAFEARPGDLMVMKLTLGAGAFKAPIRIEAVELETVRLKLKTMAMVRVEPTAL